MNPEDITIAVIHEISLLDIVEAQSCCGANLVLIPWILRNYRFTAIPC